MMSDDYLQKTNCIWKIENVNIYERGIIKWNHPYRIKHFASGLYLKVVYDQNTKVIFVIKNIELSIIA